MYWCSLIMLIVFVSFKNQLFTLLVSVLHPGWITNKECTHNLEFGPGYFLYDYVAGSTDCVGR